jgi:hypothetical protein
VRYEARGHDIWYIDVDHGDMCDNAAQASGITGEIRASFALAAIQRRRKTVKSQVFAVASTLGETRDRQKQPSLSLALPRPSKPECFKDRHSV